jgi:hypothetical protein
MDAKKQDTKISNRNASFLPDGGWRATNGMPKLDQCAFTGWLLESNKPHAGNG